MHNYMDLYKFYGPVMDEWDIDLWDLMDLRVARSELMCVDLMLSAEEALEEFGAGPLTGGIWDRVLARLVEMTDASLG